MALPHFGRDRPARERIDRFVRARGGRTAEREMTCGHAQSGAPYPDRCGAPCATAYVRRSCATSRSLRHIGRRIMVPTPLSTLARCAATSCLIRRAGGAREGSSRAQLDDASATGAVRQKRGGLVENSAMLCRQLDLYTGLCMTDAQFDPGGFFQFDLAHGRVRTRGGARVLVLAENVLATLIVTAVQNGDLTAIRTLSYTILHPQRWNTKGTQWYKTALHAMRPATAHNEQPSHPAAAVHHLLTQCQQHETTQRHNDKHITNFFSKTLLQ